MELKEKVITGLKWTASARIVCQFVSWGITIVVIRMLTSSDYGLMVLAASFTGFLSLINELGLGAAIVQTDTLNEKTIAQYFGLIMISNCLICFFLLVVAPAIGDFFNESRIETILRVLSLQFIVTGFSVVPYSLLLKSMDFKTLSLIDVISSVVGSFTTLALCVLGFGVWCLVWGNLLNIMVKTAMLVYIRPYKRIPSLCFKGMGVNILFGNFVVLGRVLWFVYNQADVFIIGKVLGQKELGFYSVGMELASMPMDKLSSVLNQVAFPAFASIKQEHEKLRDSFLKAVRLISFISFPVLWGISSIAPLVIIVFLGEKWRPSVLSLQLLSLLIPLRMVSNLMQPTLMGLGRADSQFFNVLVHAITIPIGLLIGIRWGLEGVCLAWILCFSVGFLVNLSKFVKLIKTSMNAVWLQLKGPFFSAVVMYVSVTLSRLLLNEYTSCVVTMIASITVGAIVYVAVIFIIDRKSCQAIVELLIQLGNLRGHNYLKWLNFCLSRSNSQNN